MISSVAFVDIFMFFHHRMNSQGRLKILTFRVRMWYVSCCLIGRKERKNQKRAWKMKKWKATLNLTRWRSKNISKSSNESWMNSRAHLWWFCVIFVYGDFSSPTDDLSHIIWCHDDIVIWEKNWNSMPLVFLSILDVTYTSETITTLFLNFN